MPEDQQGVRGQHQTRLEGLRDDLGRPRFHQLFEVRIIGRAHQDRDLRPCSAHRAHDPDGDRGRRESHHHRTRVGESGRPEQVGVGGVAEHHQTPSRATCTHPRRIEIHREAFVPLRLEHTREVLSHPTVAAEDHMLARREFGDGAILRRQLGSDTRGRPALAQQEPCDAAVLTQEQRRAHHAEHDRDQQRLTDLIRHHLALDQDGEDRDAELAPHRQHDSGPHRLEGGQPPQPADQRHQQEFADRHHDQDAEDQHEIVLQNAQVEHHAHRDEEQPQQDVAERPDGGLDLMPVLRLREHHAREERACGHRDTRGMGHPRRAEHDQ